MSDFAIGNRYWVPHKEEAFAPAVFKSLSGNEAAFEYEGVALKVAKVSDTKIYRVIENQLHGVDDACDLEEATLPAILHTLKVRYLKANPSIYCRVARIMIAVNPFQALPSMYGTNIMKKYRDCADSTDLEPHIFGISDDALKGLLSIDQSNQALLVSGESGAGKTESTKLVLSYMLDALQSADGDAIQDKIMRTNIVLEAFGNARTLRNNNSSRFGKWLEVSVDRTSTSRPIISGATVIDYLLELTRVTRPGAKERNYHVFFQVISSKAKLGSHMNILEPGEYNYIKGSQLEAPTINDDEWFEELSAAFAALGLSEETQLEIFKTVCGILTLGNIEFEDVSDEAKIKDEKNLNDTANCFGLAADRLKTSLLIKVLKVGNEVSKTPRNVAAATQSRDALARLLYGRLFTLLIGEINSQLGGKKTKAGHFFGLLDIAGFESFDVNSLEQLFINLSNEHMQAHFNDHIFRSELQACKDEGVEIVGGLTYKDNSDIIALIDSKTSVLATLDEEVSVPKGSDQGYLGKLVKKFDKHERFIKPKFDKDLNFGINHYAGLVDYTVGGFLEKNVDKPPDDAGEVIGTSSLGILKKIGEILVTQIKDKKKKTVGSSFRSSLKSLIEKLKQAEPHFIRCIKPNAMKVQGTFEPPMVADQLTFSGVTEAVKIRQSGFSMRVEFAEFINRFKLVLPKKMQIDITAKRKAGADLLDIIKTMVPELATVLGKIGTFPVGSLCIGRTRVFCRQQAQLLLTRARDLGVVGYAVQIQAVWRGYSCRAKFKQIKAVFALGSEWLKKHEALYATSEMQGTACHIFKGDLIKMAANADEAAGILEKIKVHTTLKFPHASKLQLLCDQIRQEIDILEKLPSLETSLEALSITQWIARAAQLNLGSHPKITALKDRGTRLNVQVPLRKAMETCLGEAEKDKEHMEQLEVTLKEAKLHEYPGNWILELDMEKIVAPFFQALTEVRKTAGKANSANKPEEKKSAKTRKSRRSVTGLDDDAVMTIFTEINGALSSYNFDELESALQEVVRHGIEEIPAVVAGKQMFANMNDASWLEKAISEESNNTDKAIAGQRLSNLLRKAQEINAPTHVIMAAKKAKQDSAQSRARKTLANADIAKIEDLDGAETNLINEAYSDLSSFSGLKDGATSESLKHQGQPIRAALTRVGSINENEAISAFVNIQACMGDKAQTTLARAHVHDDLTNLAKTSKVMADEIYVQTMKQMTDNPLQRSISRGWNLILNLAGNAPPSSALFEYILVFCLKSMQDPCNEEYVPIIQNAIEALHQSAKKTRGVKGKDGFGTNSLQILLMDRSFRWVAIGNNTTAMQATELLCDQLKLGNPNDWALNVVTEPTNLQRMLPRPVTIAFIMKTISVIKKETGNRSWLLFKRVSLKTGEILDPRNYNHAALTYHQAHANFLQCMLPSADKENSLEIAAHVLHVEESNYQDVISGKIPLDPDVLAQLIPKVEAQRFPTNFDFHSAIMKHYRQIDSIGGDKRSTKLVAMNRAYQLFQKMPLFGCYWWDGEIVTSAGIDLIDERAIKVGFATVAKRNGVKPDPNEQCSSMPPISSVIFSVSYQDIALFSVEKHECLFRFGFASAADERLIAWEPKGKHIQLLATCKEGTQIKPLLFTFKRIGVNDIAYAIETLYKNAGWKK